MNGIARIPFLTGELGGILNLIQRNQKEVSVEAYCVKCKKKVEMLGG